ncbi:hypothetical protein Tco_0800846 [Tanacetum coccineum]|uniref:Uncharacterized protein n=1 Tax=Tanacetum coccineum TaxID=301880 RepID=A0ABQ4ZYR4_9ASTR
MVSCAVGHFDAMAWHQANCHGLLMLLASSLFLLKSQQPPLKQPSPMLLPELCTIIKTVTPPKSDRRGMSISSLLRELAIGSHERVVSDVNVSLKTIAGNSVSTEPRLEEEKARRRGKVYNWETTKYGKIWYDEDIHDLVSVETKFPAISFNNEVSSKTLSHEPTVSSLNDESDFRVSFDDSDDEDYTVIFDKNSFSYKKNSTNDLKTDSENDNKKVNLPSPEPTVSCLDDLDFFKDFENEFPAIVYNDALTSKSDFSTEPTLSPQHIKEFDLKDETSLSEYEDNDDDKIDIEHSSGDLSVKPLPDVINTDDGAYAHESNKLLETRPREGKSTNISEGFTNLEIHYLAHYNP